MQYLQVGGWQKASALPDSPRVIEKLLARGWIERKPGPADRVLYRIPEKGTTAKKARIPYLTLPAKARRFSPIAAPDENECPQCHPHALSPQTISNSNI